MKNWILNKKITLAITVLGAILGYLYWDIVGCTSGTCAIASVWYRMTIYGAVLGWFLGGIINDKVAPSKKEKNE